MCFIAKNAKTSKPNNNMSIKLIKLDVFNNEITLTPFDCAQTIRLILECGNFSNALYFNNEE